MAEQRHWVMDYETLSDCFLGVFEHYKTDEVKVFTSGKLRNNIVDFIKFLEDNIRNNEWHISFNGLGFDSQITEFILKNKKAFMVMPGESIGKLIYKEAQEAIRRSNAREFAKYSEKKLSIKQIDVFKLNHWDNPAKRSSLKWIECSMDWHNVQDMPIDHTESISTVEQLKEIASYCRNDVAATKKIMQLNKKQITLRQNLTGSYKVNLNSASEPRIAKELFMHFMSKKTGMSKYDLKNLRTFRKSIYVKDLILPYINFEGVPEYQELLRNFRNLILDPNETKGGFKYAVKYRGLTAHFGLGGVHAAKKGIYESDEDNIILSSDVVSYYPNLAIRNQWAPAQFNAKAFLDQYEWFFDERRLIPKSNPLNYVYKLILNSTYGLSNDKNSFLYDPEFTMRITINGQLSLMLAQVRILNEIPGSVPLMLNTDGFEIQIPRKYKDKYIEICDDWQKLTKLELEHDIYEKLIIPDVNNYIGVFQKEEITKDEFYKNQINFPDNKFSKSNGKFYMSKIKCKGRFEFNDRALHKNKSFAIVPKAIFNFFVHGTPPETSLKNNKNIFDYCGQTRARGDWGFNFIHAPRQLQGKYKTYTPEQKAEYLKSKGWFENTVADNWVNGNSPNHEANTGMPGKSAFFHLAAESMILSEPLQKTLRYLVSNRGGKLVKHNKTDGRNIQVESGKWLQTVFNTYEDRPFEQYDLNKTYYMTKIKKEIESLVPEAFSTQMKIQF